MEKMRERQAFQKKRVFRFHKVLFMKGSNMGVTSS